jgi:hypothetical protein
MPQQNMPDEPPEVKALREAVAGLEYPSESDRPFDVFRWPGDTAPAREAVAAHAGAGRKIDEVTVDEFLKQLEGSDDAERFRQLRRTLESQLKGLKIFRVGGGEVKVDVYLIGRARSGEWVGLHTVSVET